MSTDNLFNFALFKNMPEPNSIQVGNTEINIIEEPEVPNTIDLPIDELISDNFSEPAVTPNEKNMCSEVPINKKQTSLFHDLFWLINPKLQKKLPIGQGEASVVTISFNIDFGNLRINFYTLPENKQSIIGTKILHKNLVFLTSTTLYPKACLDILNDKTENYFPMEQLIADGTENYIKDLSTSNINKINTDTLRITIQHVKGVKQPMFYYYDFTDIDLVAFKYSLEFSLDKGLQLSIENKINGRNN